MNEYIRMQKCIDKLKVKEAEKNIINEDKIEESWNKIREIYIKSIEEKSRKYYKSPIYGLPIKLNDDQIIYSSYERSIENDVLEARCDEWRNKHEKWKMKNVVCGSGIQSIKLVLDTCLYINRKRTTPIKILVWGSYFETRMLFELMENSIISIKYCTSITELYEGISLDFDLIYIEPVRYDIDLQPVDIELLVDSFRKTEDKEKRRFVIMDSTLVGNLGPMDNLLELLSSYKHISFFNINSLLKLNQQGLEFSNAGVITLYINIMDNEIAIDKLYQLLIEIRNINGAGISLRNMMLLNNQLFFDKKEVDDYCRTVFKNNQYFATLMIKNKLFGRVSHPGIGSNKSEMAPFVILQLKEDILSNYCILLAILKYESKKRKIDFYMGSSFGFRHSRYELIIPNNTIRWGFFKVAMGYRYDVVEEILELFRYLEEFDTIERLKKAYGFLEPIKI